MLSRYTAEYFFGLSAIVTRSAFLDSSSSSSSVSSSEGASVVDRVLKMLLYLRKNYVCCYMVRFLKEKLIGFSASTVSIYLM